MAQQILACIYGVNGNDLGRATGVYYGFPVDEIVFVPILPTETMSGVACKTKIKVLSGADIFLFAPEFYTDKSVTDLVTASNL